MRIRCMGCMEEYDSYYDICPWCGTMKNIITNLDQRMRPETILYQQYMIGLAMDVDDVSTTYIGYDLVNLQRVVINEYKILPGNMRIFQKEKIFGLIGVKDIFAEGSMQYIVTEYISGETLEHRIVSENLKTFEQILCYMIPVMEILIEMHKRGIFHLKVSPGNIFLLDSGEVKLMIPGVYQSVVGCRRKKNVYLDEKLYMAPELKEGTGDGGMAADVYSVCAIVYRMQMKEFRIKKIKKKTAVMQLFSRKKRGRDTRMNSILNGLLSDESQRTQHMGELLRQLTSVQEIEKMAERF